MLIGRKILKLQKLYMTNIKNKKNILWDFDGVLMDSMPIRNKGFQLVLKEYPEDEVNALMDFHNNNGGLSRYVKFRYFFEEIRNEKVNEIEINSWAEKFSTIMKENLIDQSLLIPETLNFIKENYSNFDMHIVSGSDQEELKWICSSLDISKYFVSINGSPTPKIDLVNNLLLKHGYQRVECVLIGDSINDYEAATKNTISFSAYNNQLLNKYNDLIFPSDFL